MRSSADKPAWEIESLEGSEIDFQMLEEINELGNELQVRLHWVARIGMELLNRGWDAYGLLYDINFYKQIQLESQTRAKGSGLDSDKVGLEEEELEDE